ncbi:TcdA/TcdB pore-forming domain-containing protein [Pseudomonas fluorescens]|uniref:Toxin n=1 Tax=Pseudomonas fluorescens TaxID=294 RepID=A0A423LWL5_PSEFL|nr:TcdA/TcdB pore-forming domain-containing protein [Pseudomonas fluorescens]RON72672.1 hypothetical protein BK671_02095 [Pseudomonas fluorescens]
MLQAISLLKDTLQTLGRDQASVVFGNLFEKVEKYHQRLQNTVAITAREVPGHMHFVWVGGAMFGANQRDYFNIWKAQTPKDLTFSIWYDPQALMAFDVSRTIIQAAKADAMLAGGDQTVSRAALIRLYEKRLAVLRRQAFEFIQQAQLRGLAPDEARIELLVQAYGQDRTQLHAARTRYLQSHLDMADDRVRLRNAREEFQSHALWSAYDREISLRGNFAAASDIVRLQAVYKEGGTYSDLDYLPPLADEMGGVNISKLSKEARSGVLQLVLDYNKQLMPGRDNSQYRDLLKHIPAENLAALEVFAKSSPGLDQVFAPLAGQTTSLDVLGLGSPFDMPAVGLAPRLMNAFIVTHPEAGMTLSSMKLIRYYYDVIESVEQALDKKGLTWGDDEVLDITKNKMREIDLPFTGGEALTRFRSEYETRIIGAIFDYHRDGVVPGVEGTIKLTGPGAVLVGSEFFAARQYTILGTSKVKALQHIKTGYNTDTEEELISGWKQREVSDAVWIKNEQDAWRDGKFKARYQANLQDLLKSGITLTFKRGWPVVEGKPVMLTSVLQRLIDDLGEPFIRAMADKLSGDVIFQKSANLSYDERQQIIQQTVSETPLSVGAQHANNLNELLTHLERGSLPIEQMSPLQRVVVGGLFGAQSLDVAGFADAWQAARDLARATADGGVFARYAALEKLLQQRQAPAFQAALAQPAKPGNQTARELKALALSDLLTLNQWGRQIAQINTTAQWEYRAQILKRAAPVREQFFKAGALSARQLPQALLMRTAGDPGRRCYPLALLMAAALSRGESAERAVIGRIANANLAPQENDSRALLLALDELRDVRMSDVGAPLGEQSLQAIVRGLEAKADSSVLLLDTGSHALLVAKVVTADSTAYRFFEPNFAVYGFTQGSLLQQGIEGYLSRDGGELARLYGLADATDLRFNVIELNTAAIADHVLPSSLQVSSLLQNTPIAGGQSVNVWEAQSALRGRSLSENARMGDSLVQLDMRNLVREFDLATVQLRREHALGTEYLPLLETLQTAADNHSTLTMVDAGNPAKRINVTTRDTRFSKLKKNIQRLVEAVAGKGGSPGESDGGSRLSFAFAIQTLVTEMRSREYQEKNASLPALTVALQIQVYVSYVQLAYGVAMDSVQIINLVRQVATSEQALARQTTSLSGRLLGRGAAATGIVFSLANIGFDIYGLSVADNDEQRSRLTTQLAFDVAALGLDVAALAVGGTLGAAASFLSVPLLGIGIGVTAIASNLGQISDKARAVGRHLFDIHEAYGPEGCKRQDGVLQFAVEAVITELDLRARRVRFDSQKFFPTDSAGSGLPSYSGKPSDLPRAINIREAMSRYDSLEFGKGGDRDIHAVVLPCTPICYYGYEYQVGNAGFAPDDDLYSRLSTYQTVYEGAPKPEGGLEAGVRTSYPNILDIWKEQIEFSSLPPYERRFQFFANTSLPHILYKLLPVNKPTHISVELDAHARYLVVPELPKQWQQLLSYDIAAENGLYQLTLTPGIVSVHLSQRLPVGVESLNLWQNAVSWVIKAPWAIERQVRFDGNTLIIDGIRVTGFSGHLQLSDGELFQFDSVKKAWQLQSVTLSKADGESPIAEQSSVTARLRALALANRLASAYVPVHNFIVPFNDASDVQYTSAYYDVAADRMLYVRNLPAALREGIVLGAASTLQAWFYHPEHATVWRVDVSTGLVRQAYRLLSPRKGSTILACELSADGQLRVVQEKISEEQNRFTLEYLIAQDTVTFVHLNAFLNEWREDIAEVAYWKEPLRRFVLPDEKLGDLTAMNVPMSTWTSAPFVGLRAHFQGKSAFSGWVRLSDYRFYSNDSESAQKIMLMWASQDSDAALFFDMDNQTLTSEFADSEELAYVPAEILAEEVAEVTQSAGRYFMTKTNGQMFEIDKDGVLTFIGVGKRWLERHPDWFSTLPILVVEHGKRPFPVIGLSDFSQSALLAVWSCNDRLLLSEAGLGKELALLGLTPDGEAGWLFDIEAGQVYRQPLSSLESARDAFAGGTRLRYPQRLPAAQKVWSEWSFVEVITDGQGMLGRTREGVNLALTDQQPARIVSVENHWAQADQGGLSLQARLKNLLAGHAHAAVLPVKSFGSSYTYYVAEQDQLLEVQARQDGQWSAFLGVQNSTQPLLFDPVDGVVFNRGSKTPIRLADSQANRQSEVLTLESASEVSDLQTLLLEGVDTLILAFGAATQSCHVSEQVWQRLDCLVVDRRHTSEDSLSVEHTLVLDMADRERLLLSQAQGHLLLIDPDSAHTLIVRDNDPLDEQRIPMYLSISSEGQVHRVSIERLLGALKTHAQGVIELKGVLESLAD